MYGLSPVFTYVWLLSNGIEIMSSFVGVRNMLAVWQSRGEYILRARSRRVHMS